MGYKLTYFNGRGAGECIRFLFKYGGIDFEDVRVDLEAWPAMKPSTLFGQLPLLEVDGKQVNQSTAIERFVAKKVKLVGKDDWEDLEIDAVVDTINDIRTKMAALFHESDEGRKAEIVKKLEEETFPYYFGKLDKIAEKNKGHMAVGRLTWADFHLTASFAGSNAFFPKDVIGNYPNLKAVRDTVNNLPGVKEWIASRPETPF